MTTRMKASAESMQASSTPSLSKRDVADRFGVSVDTVERWHNAGQGPARYSLPGGTVRYAEADLLAWSQARVISPRWAA